MHRTAHWGHDDSVGYGGGHLHSVGLGGQSRGKCTRNHVIKRTRPLSLGSISLAATLGHIELQQSGAVQLESHKSFSMLPELSSRLKLLDWSPKIYSEIARPSRGPALPVAT